MIQVPLGLLLKNENKNEDMLDILQELHDQYVPASKNRKDGEEVVKLLEQIFFGGDQLTDERGRHAAAARSDGDDPFERLEGLLMKIEDWHGVRILYQVCKCELIEHSKSRT